MLSYGWSIFIIGPFLGLCVMPLDQCLLTIFTGLVEVKKPSLCRKVFCVLYFGTSDTHKFLEYFGRIWFDGSFFGV